MEEPRTGRGSLRIAEGGSGGSAEHHDGGHAGAQPRWLFIERDDDLVDDVTAEDLRHWRDGNNMPDGLLTQGIDIDRYRVPDLNLGEVQFAQVGRLDLKVLQVRHDDHRLPGRGVLARR